MLEESIAVLGELRLTVVAERYFKALKEGKVHGYLFEQENIIPKREGEQL